MDEFINSSTVSVETSDEDLLYKIDSLKNFYQRDHVVAVLKQFGPYRFFGTLSFQYKLSYWQAKEFASVHARDVMKILFGKKRQKEFSILEGIAIMEEAPLFVGAKWNNYHFHYLIKDDPRLPRDGEAALKLLNDAFVKATRRLVLKGVHRRGRKVADLSLVSEDGGTLVKLIDNSERLYRYVTKEARSRDWDWVDRIYHLGKDGLQSSPS